MTDVTYCSGCGCPGYITYCERCRPRKPLPAPPPAEGTDR